jgi:hypothetical protein
MGPARGRRASVDRGRVTGETGRPGAVGHPATLGRHPATLGRHPATPGRSP